MLNEPISSRLRAFRKRSGLNQNELAQLAGCDPADVSRHEWAQQLPTFVVSLAYEIIFDACAAELFPGIYETVRHGVENRIAAMKFNLEQQSAKGRKANGIAHKLEWVYERQNG